MPQKITLYSTQFCPFCVRAKKLLQSKKYDFEEIDLTNDHEKRQEISERTGWMSVPMVFIGEEFIGGCDELYSLEDQGLLDSKINS